MTLKFGFDRRGRGGMHGGFHAKVHAKTAVGEIYLYDAIGEGWFGGIGAKHVVAALEEVKRAGAKSLSLFINSPGGDVFEATAMMSALGRFDGPKTAHIDGLAASAASFLPMIAEKIITAHNGMWMIHNPWAMAMGEAADMRASAERLDKVRDQMVESYARRTKQTPDQLKAWLDAETWMTAAEAKERGFTDEITDDDTIAEDSMAFSLLERFERTPDRLRSRARLRSARLREAQGFAERQRSSLGQPGEEGRQAASR